MTSQGDLLSEERRQPFLEIEVPLPFSAGTATGSEEGSQVEIGTISSIETPRITGTR